MKKLLFTVALCALLLLPACSSQQAQEPDGTLHIVATTYPVYCFTTAVTEGVAGVEVDLLVNQQTSCLHDYTLTVTDMKAIEQADVLVINGAGLEDFMDDALAASNAVQLIDCSKDLPLLTMADVENDPHIWMAPGRASHMISCIGNALSSVDADNAEAYASNTSAALEALSSAQSRWQAQADALPCKNLITFHDGFQYFADAFGLTVLASVEEEEGSEASAADINYIASLVKENNLTAIFTEINGSDATAQTISRETDAAVYPLDLMMSGDASGLQPYLDTMQANLDTLTEAFS